MEVHPLLAGAPGCRRYLHDKDRARHILDTITRAWEALGCGAKIGPESNRRNCVLPVYELWPARRSR